MIKLILQALSIFFLVLLSANIIAAEKEVPLYGIFETDIRNNNDYINPFDYSEVSFHGQFISPDSKTFNVASFYDGVDAQQRHLWKIRFMPNQPGTWHFQLKNISGETIRTGNFIVTTQTANSGNHGHVKVDKHHPRYLIHDDGSAHYWVGGKWISAKDYGPKNKNGQTNQGIDQRVKVLHGHKTNQQLIDYLDLLVKYEHNGLLLKIAQFPLENDRMSWDLQWIQRGEWVVEQALKRGIYVQINMFDTWSRDKHKYFENKMPGADHLFDVWKDGDDKFKQNYLKYIVSRFSAYANVYWELGNEMEHSPNCGPCFTELANSKYIPWIKQADPYKLPIGLSEGVWRSSNVDIGFLHQTNELPDETMHRPVIMNELVRYTLHQSFLQKVWRKLFGKRLHSGLWHDEAINNKDLRFTYRRTFWNVFTRGGSGSSEATWLDISNSASNNVQVVMRDHMHFKQLIDIIQPSLNTMVPVQNFIQSNNIQEIISTRGNEKFYVSYFDAGYTNTIKASTISINKRTADYTASWINPSTGKVISESRLLQTQMILTRPEYFQDIALILSR